MEHRDKVQLSEYVIYLMIRAAPADSSWNSDKGAVPVLRHPLTSVKALHLAYQLGLEFKFATVREAH